MTKLATLAGRLVCGLLISVVIALVAWYLWLNEEWLKAFTEYRA